MIVGTVAKWSKAMLLREKITKADYLTDLCNLKSLV